MFARPRVEPQPRERNPRERCQELHMTPLICDPTGADLDEVAVGELMNLGFDFNLQRSPRVTRLRSGEEVHSRLVDLAFSGPVLDPATSQRHPIVLATRRSRSRPVSSAGDR